MEHLISLGGALGSILSTAKGIKENHTHMDLQDKWSSLRESGHPRPCLSASKIKETNAITHLRPSHMYIDWGTATLSYGREVSEHGLRGSGEWRSQLPVSFPNPQFS